MRKLVSSNRLSLIGLLETKISYSKRLQIARELLPGWRVVFNYRNQCNGRIRAVWDPSTLIVKVLSSSAQLLHLSVQVIETHRQFLVSLVYGMNTPQERALLWDHISSLFSASHSLPWVLLGDFNVGRSVAKKLGGNMSWTSAMDDLNTCCYAAELEDL